MTAITKNMTKAQLVALVEELLGDKAMLINEKAQLVDEIVSLKNQWQEARDQKTENNYEQPKKLEQEEGVVLLRRTLKSLNFQSQVDDEFISNFQVFVNPQDHWMGVKPIKATKETARFLKEVSQRAYKKGLKNNIWKNTGLWMKK